MNLFECFPSYYFCPHRLWRKTELDSVCSGRLPRELFYNLFSHMINGWLFFFVFVFYCSHNGAGVFYSGSWDSQGCVLNEEESDSFLTVCECNHLAHCGIVVSPGIEIDSRDRIRLNVFGIVCVAISLVAMALTVVIHICFK